MVHDSIYSQDGVNELQDEEQAEVLEEFNIEVVDVESADGVENSILHLTSLNWISPVNPYVLQIEEEVVLLR